MVAPYVDVTERLTGAPTARDISMTRVAGVGVATKGLYNKFSLIGTDDDLRGIYGWDTKDLSLGLRIATDEGAGTDKAGVRVMGAARRASGAFTVTGTGVTSDTVRLTISLAGNPNSPWVFDASLASAETAASIVAELIGLLAASGTVPVTGIVDPSQTNRLILSAKALGAAGNNITFLVEEIGAGPDDLTFAPSVTTNLADGADGPAKARVVVGTGADEFTFEAFSEGVWAHSVTDAILTAIPNSPRSALLTLTRDDGIEETAVLNFTLDGVVNGNEIAGARATYSIRCFYTGNGNVATAALPLGAFTLANGSDGSPILPTDYVSALEELARNRANIIFAPQQSSSTIRASLTAQAESATLRDGLRIAIVNSKKGMLVSEAETEFSAINSGTGSVQGATGWASYANEPLMAANSCSPDSFLAGIRARVPAHISCHARRSAGFFRTVTSVDTRNDKQAVDIYTDDGRMEAIINDPDVGGYACLNGRTLSTVSQNYHLSSRLIVNKAKTLIYRAAQELKGENDTGDLLRDVARTGTNILDQMVAAGEIRRGSLVNQVRTATGVRTELIIETWIPVDALEYVLVRETFEV